MRSHPVGTLRAENAGQTVTLAGWVARRRDHGGVIFIDLRDASGTAQVVFREGEMAERAHRLRSEFCLQVTGEVVLRPEGNENPELSDRRHRDDGRRRRRGALVSPRRLPFQIDDHIEVGEEIASASYRYLDLRRSEPRSRRCGMRSEGQPAGRAGRAARSATSSRSRRRL